MNGMEKTDAAWADTETGDDDIPTFDLTPETPETNEAKAPLVSRSAGPKASAPETPPPAPAPEVRPVQFMPFDDLRSGRGNSNIDLLMDVPLPVVVELGRTSMLVKEILSLGPGSIIELDKAAGENVDILVNGRLIAKGEVVVIEENFGVRIVEFVTTPEKAVQ